jgi:hypothetical protein
MHKYDKKIVKEIMAKKENQLNIDAQPEFWELPNALELMLVRLKKSEMFEEENKGFEDEHFYMISKKLHHNLLNMFKPAIIKDTE